MQVFEPLFSDVLVWRRKINYDLLCVAFLLASYHDIYYKITKLVTLRIKIILILQEKKIKK